VIWWGRRRRGDIGVCWDDQGGCWKRESYQEIIVARPSHGERCDFGFSKGGNL